MALFSLSHCLHSTFTVIESEDCGEHEFYGVNVFAGHVTEKEEDY